MSNEDISYLDFEVPDELKEYEEKLANTPKAAAIVTSINDLGVFASFCVVNDIEAVVLPSGVFGSIAFLSGLKNGAPEESTKRLTLCVRGLDAVLAQFKQGRMSTVLWRNGEPIEEQVPTLVLGNLSEVAEDALIGELDLFELTETGQVKVNSKHARESLPVNFIPKKYQTPIAQNGNIRQFKAVSTRMITKEQARKNLQKFTNK